MTPLQQLVSFSLYYVKTRPIAERAVLLDAAASVFDGPIADCLRAEAECFKSAEAHQMKLTQLLQEATR